MKKIILSAAAILMVTASLSAEPVKGAYIGLGFGASQFNDDGYGDDFTAYATRVSPGNGVSVEDGSSGYKIYGGYQFNKIFAVEASYTDYGKSYSIEMTTGYSEVLEPTSLSISANLGYNFGNEGEYRPFATIGFANVNFNESGTGTVYQDTSATAVRFGLGFEYTPSSLNGFGFRVAYEGDSFETTNTYGAEFKSSYNQTLALFYLGAQYKF